MPRFPCPECDAEVPVAGVGVMADEGLTGNVDWRPMRERTTCPGCGARLVRYLSPPTDRWHLLAPEEGGAPADPPPPP